jgi:general secretion pathway protein B
MSVILDALRKLDREKMSHRNAPANIAAEILRPDLPRPGKKFPLYFTTISLTAIAAVVMTYAVMSKFGFLPKSSLPEPSSPPGLTQQVAPVSSAQKDSSLLPKSSPPMPANLPAPSQHMTSVPIESGVPSKSSLPAPTNSPVSSQAVAPTPVSQEPARDARDEISHVSPKIEPPTGSKTSKIVAPPLKGSTTTLPSLKLSAIVWYEEPSKRFVMVNGVIANEGSFVEGVKVEEIYPDRVRFSHNGRPFEIPIK